MLGEAREVAEIATIGLFACATVIGTLKTDLVEFENTVGSSRISCAVEEQTLESVLSANLAARIAFAPRINEP